MGGNAKKAIFGNVRTLVNMRGVYIKVGQGGICLQGEGEYHQLGKSCRDQQLKSVSYEGPHSPRISLIFLGERERVVQMEEQLQVVSCV